MVRSMDSLMIASVRSPWFDLAERMVAHKKRKQTEMKLNRHCNASSRAIQHDKHKPTVSRQANLSGNIELCQVQTHVGLSTIRYMCMYIIGIRNDAVCVFKSLEAVRCSEHLQRDIMRWST